MAECPAAHQSLDRRLRDDLPLDHPVELMRLAGSLIPLVQDCDDPRTLSAAIDHAQSIDRALQSSGVARNDRNAAAELKLWAMWRLGAWLIDADLLHGQRGGQGEDEGQPWRLETIGIDRSTSSRCRKLGKIPRDDFESRLRTAALAARAMTITWVLDRDVQTRRDNVKNSKRTRPTSDQSRKWRSVTPSGWQEGFARTA